MGTSMLGFLVKGPVDLSDKKQEAIAHVTAVQARAAAQLAKLPEDDVTVDELLGPWADEQCQIFDIEEAVDFLESLQAGNPQELVESFMTFWANCDGRDTNSRTDPDDDTQQLVFAGCASYGDEPDGHGYTNLKKMFQLGLNKVFNIR